MSLVGNLADLGLADILQIVSLSRRSGTLQLTTPVESGEITFSQGSVIGAYRTQGTQTVAEGLLELGVLTPTGLQEALAGEGRGERGVAAFRAAGLDPGATQEALETLLKRVVYPMFDWTEGTFSFVLEDQPEPWRAFGFNGTRVVLDRGLSPQFLAMEGARLRDERAKDDTLEAFLAHEAKKAGEELTAVNVERIAERLREGSEGRLAAAAAPRTDDKVIPFPATRVRREPPPPAPAARSREVDARPREAVPEVARATEAAAAVAVAPAVAVPAPEVEPAQAPAVTVPAAGPGVLVVDDDPQLAALLKSTLGPKLGEVLTATTVADAMAYLRGQPVALVATDLILARSDGRGILGGLEVLEAVRGLAPALPVVMFTDYKNIEAEQKARSAGVTDILMKPRKAELFAGGAPSGKTQAFVVELEGVLARYAAAVVTAPPVAPPPATAEVGAAPPAAVVEPTEVAAHEVMEVAPERLPTEEAMATAAEEAGPVAPPPVAGGYDIRRELVGDVGDLSAAPDLPPLDETDPRLVSLRSMLAELSDPANRDTITLLALRYASEFVERAALFLAARHAFIGLGGFCAGETSDHFVARVRTVQLPSDAESVFTRIMRYRAMIRGPLLDTPANRELLEGLGGGWHSYTAVAIPLVSGGRVAAVLYGDNPSGKPLGPTDTIEIFIQQAGLAMDRALLERRLEEIRRTK